MAAITGAVVGAIGVANSIKTGIDQKSGGGITHLDTTNRRIAGRR